MSEIIIDIPYIEFNQLLKKKKKAFMFVNHGKYSHIPSYKTFIVKSIDSANKEVSLKCSVRKVFKYDSVSRAIEMEGIRKLSPHIKTVDTSAKVSHYYKKHISHELESIFGVVVVYI